jgi:hypothetical protein
MFKHLIRKILGRQSQAEKKIVSPYVGLTDAQIIERRRKIAVLYPTPMRPLHETHLDIFEGDK